MNKTQIVRTVVISAIVVPVLAATVLAWCQQPDKAPVTFPIMGLVSSAISSATAPQAPVTLDSDEEGKIVVKTYKAPNRTSKRRTKTPKFSDHQWVCWEYDHESGIKSCAYRDDPRNPVHYYRETR
jgi:hypothetical protein